MRAKLLECALAMVAMAGMAACSSSSNTATTTTTTDQSAAAASSAAASEAPEATDTPESSATTAASEDIPIYPDANVSSDPGDLGMKKLPPSAKIYVSTDAFAKVQAWYRAQLKGANEMAQPGKEKSMDAFLVGQGASGKVVMIQSLHGDTFIVIGPPN